MFSKTAAERDPRGEWNWESPGGGNVARKEPVETDVRAFYAQKRREEPKIYFEPGWGEKSVEEVGCGNFGGGG